MVDSVDAVLNAALHVERREEAAKLVAAAR
jgi:hypothetical protein